MDSSTIKHYIDIYYYDAHNNKDKIGQYIFSNFYEKDLDVWFGKGNGSTKCQPENTGPYKFIPIDCLLKHNNKPIPTNYDDKEYYFLGADKISPCFIKFSKFQEDSREPVILYLDGKQIMSFQKMTYDGSFNLNVNVENGVKKFYERGFVKAMYSVPDYRFYRETTERCIQIINARTINPAFNGSLTEAKGQTVEEQVVNVEKKVEEIHAEQTLSVGGAKTKQYVVYKSRRYLVRKNERKRCIKVKGTFVFLRDIKGQFTNL